MILGMVSIHNYAIKIAEIYLFDLIHHKSLNPINPISEKYACWFYQIQLMILGMVSIHNYDIKRAETGLFDLIPL